jgi:hypothetical protein
MNKAFLFANLLIITLISCKQDPKIASQQLPSIQAGEHASPMVLAGNWIAMDFVARANQYGSVLQTMNNSHLPFAYAISFNPAKPDSALCFNASKFWMMALRYNVDTIQLLGDPSGKPVYLIYHATSNTDKEITMIDPTGPKVKMDRFIKSKAEVPEAYTAFTIALNHNILSGTFTPIGGGKGTKGPVKFDVNGFMTGFKDFDRYVLCTGGDCLVAGQEIDVITFYSPKTEFKPNYYGYKYNGQNDTLTLYNLINATPDVKGSYKVGSPAYKFSRKVSQ